MKSREKCMLGLLIRYAPIGVGKKKMPEEMFFALWIYFFCSCYSSVLNN